MSTNKYGGSGGFRKAPFCNHHSKDQFRQQPAIYAKCKVGGWTTNNICMVLKCLPTISLLVARVK